MAGDVLRADADLGLRRRRGGVRESRAMSCKKKKKKKKTMYVIADQVAAAVGCGDR